MRSDPVGVLVSLSLKTAERSRKEEATERSRQRTSGGGGLDPEERGRVVGQHRREPGLLTQASSASCLPSPSGAAAQLHTHGAKLLSSGPADRQCVRAVGGG